MTTTGTSVVVGTWRVLALDDKVEVIRDDGVVVAEFLYCETWDASYMALQWEIAFQCARALLNHHAPISSGVQMPTAPRIP